MPLLSSVQKVSPKYKCRQQTQKKTLLCCYVYVVIFAGSSGSLCVCVAGYIVLRCKLRFNLPVAEYYAAAKPLIGPTP